MLKGYKQRAWIDYDGVFSHYEIDDHIGWSTKMEDLSAWCQWISKRSVHEQPMWYVKNGHKD